MGVNKRVAIALFLSIAALIISNSPPTLAANPPSLALASIAIEPKTKEVKVDDEFTLSIRINTLGQAIDGAQVFLEYQPEFLQAIEVVPGTTLPVTMWNPPYFDNTTGQLWYAAGAFTDFPEIPFTLATIHFKALESTEETPITFVFDYEAGRMSKITWMGENLLLAPAVGGRVSITGFLARKMGENLLLAPAVGSRVSITTYPSLSVWGWIALLGFVIFLILAFILNRRLA